MSNFIGSLTTVQRDSLRPNNPVSGDMILNTDIGEFQVYDGVAWLTIPGSYAETENRLLKRIEILEEGIREAIYTIDKWPAVTREELRKLINEE